MNINGALKKLRSMKVKTPVIVAVELIVLVAMFCMPTILNPTGTVSANFSPMTLGEHTYIQGIELRDQSSVNLFSWGYSINPNEVAHIGNGKVIDSIYVIIDIEEARLSDHSTINTCYDCVKIELTVMVNGQLVHSVTSTDGWDVKNAQENSQSWGMEYKLMLTENNLGITVATDQVVEIYVTLNCLVP